MVLRLFVFSNADFGFNDCGIFADGINETLKRYGNGIMQASRRHAEGIKKASRRL
jgi:hypothetical protein